MNIHGIYIRPLVILMVFCSLAAYIRTSGEPEMYNEISPRQIIRDIRESSYKVRYYTDEAVIYDKSPSSSIKIGDIMEMRLTPAPAPRTDRDESFSYNKYLKSIGVKGAYNLISYRKVGEDKIYSMAGRFKDEIRRVNRVLYKESSDYINDFLIGDRASLGREKEDLFKRTGSAHLLAISGLHVDIIITALVFIVGYIISWRRLSVLAMTLYFYLIITAMAYSTLRASLIAVLSVIPVFMKRRYDAPNMLSLIVIFMLAKNPYTIYNPGFLLSFTACFSMIMFKPPIRRLIPSSIISTTIACSVLTTPLIIYMFKGASTVVIYSNLVMLPFIGIIVITDIITLILYYTLINSAFVIARINSSALELMISLIQVLSDMNFSYLEINTSEKTIIVVYYLIVLIGYAAYYIRSVKENKNGVQGIYIIPQGGHR